MARSASAPLIVFPSLIAKLLPSGGLIEKPPKGSVLVELPALLIISCRFGVGGEVVIVTELTPGEGLSTSPVPSAQRLNEPSSKSIFGGQKNVEDVESGSFPWVLEFTCW